MPNQYQKLTVVDTESFPYIFEKDVEIPPLTTEKGLIRANIFRPQDSDKGIKYPVLITYGPYGKDVPYGEFRKPSWDQINPEHKSTHSAWETPDPLWWTSAGYIVVRADERGIGQSPGVLDTMSRGTSEAFFDVIEWAAVQLWSSGKVGLLGISYYAGSQWRVAARRPKGLAAIVPWEGMSDYYRDRVRQGGILSDKFILLVNQYGRPRKEGGAFPETIEGRLSEDELKANLNDQTVDTAKYRFMDEEYFKSRDFSLADIEVPILSVAHWGGILLHLRGNVEGYTYAGSKFKYLRFITGRHDLPFYYSEEVQVQKSFLDAFLKDDDKVGWSVPGKVPKVSMCLREGDVGFNDPESERKYARRVEPEWPLVSTVCQKWYLTPEKGLVAGKPAVSESKEIQWSALDVTPTGIVSFKTAPFAERTEFTGHVTAHLNVSIARSESRGSDPPPTDLDLFLTIRHISPEGKEISYTGTAGDPCPVTKGWLRCSFRKTNLEHPWHRPYLPRREYRSTDVEMLHVGEVYNVDVEIWPTNVVVGPGASLAFEVAGADTQGVGIQRYEHPVDRSEAVFGGLNVLHFGPGKDNYVTLPYIPSK